MELLTQQTVKPFITATDLVVIMATALGCPACDSYLPIIEQVEALKPDIKFGKIVVSRTQKTMFTATYMQSGADNVPIGTPMLFVFEKGVLNYRRYGLMTIKETVCFIETGLPIGNEPQVIQDRLTELDAMMGRAQREMNGKIREIQEAYQQLANECNAEIKRIMEVSDVVQ